MFNRMGHHDMYRGCVGVLDTSKGLNFPHGLKKVTAELPWPEVGDGPTATPAAADDYHSAGGYKAPYPLSQELFLVSARKGQCREKKTSKEQNRGNFKLYLMDIHGNRKLIYEGRENVLYAQPRPRPPVIPNATVWPGPQRDKNTVAQSVLYSADVYEGLPDQMRGKAKYLRVLECVQRTYTTGCVDGGGSPFGSGCNVALDSPQFKGGNPQRQIVDKPLVQKTGALHSGNRCVRLSLN